MDFRALVRCDTRSGILGGQFPHSWDTASGVGPKSYRDIVSEMPGRGKHKLQCRSHFMRKSYPNVRHYAPSATNLALLTKDHETDERLWHAMHTRSP